MAIIWIIVYTVTESRNEDHEPEPGYRIRFSIDNASVDVTGTIGVAKAEINFLPDALDQSTIVATADASTIDTGIPIRDKHLRKSDYFDTEHFPVITLRSRTLRKVWRNSYSGIFDLTIRDITKPIPINFTVVREGDTIRYHGTFTINRIDFGLGEASAILDEQVEVTLEAVEHD